MKKNFVYLSLFVLVFGFYACQKNPVENNDITMPEEQPNLLSFEKLNSEVPTALDTTKEVSANTKQGGVYLAIVRDIIFTNPFIGIPLLSTLGSPVEHPQPGLWIWEKKIFQATHQLQATWNGSDGYDWLYVWDGGIYQQYVALEGYTDTPGLNGEYTLFYNDATHSIYGKKIWSFDQTQTLTIDWERFAYAPLNVPKRNYLVHLSPDKSGNLTFWENDVKRFYIEWAFDGSGFWEIWGINGNYLKGTF